MDRPGSQAHGCSLAGCVSERSAAPRAYTLPPPTCLSEGPVVPVTPPAWDTELPAPSLPVLPVLCVTRGPVHEYAMGTKTSQETGPRLAQGRGASVKLPHRAQQGWSIIRYLTILQKKRVIFTYFLLFYPCPLLKVPSRIYIYSLNTWNS